MSTSGSENCLFYSAAADKCLDESWKNNKWGDHDFMKDGKPRSITKNVGSSSVISETFGVLKVSGSDENKARKGIVYLRKSECDFESTGTGDCVLSSKILCLEMDEEQVLHEFGKFFFGGNCDVIKNCGLDSAFRPFVPLA